MESKTKIFGHAAHQIAIVFPLGLLATSVVYDVAAARGDEKAGQSAFAMLGSGLVGGAVSAPLGYNDWRYIPEGTRAREVGRWHGLGNAVVMALFGASWLLRRPRPERPSNLAVSLSVLGAGLALVTGWLGGELVDRLGVGVDEGAHLNAPSSLTDRPTSEPA
ncbi:MAG: DUF2231 domain-containing protein [Armatimonadetes bacterium]|nr:DUF2231 domain-containing protein [Armatimonadota bacterium]